MILVARFIRSVLLVVVHACTIHGQFLSTDDLHWNISNHSRHDFVFVHSDVSYREHIIISQLVNIFADENEIKIHSIASSSLMPSLEQTLHPDLEWIHEKLLPMEEGVRSSIESNRPELWYLPKHVQVYQCFYDFPLTKEHYQGEWSVAKLMHFINTKSGTFRTLNGTLNAEGTLFQTLERSNKFQLPPTRKEEIDPGQECERIDGTTLTWSTFLHQYALPQKPVIITNHVNRDWKAMKKWTDIQYLLKQIGSQSVHVKVAPDGIFEGCEPLTRWTLNSSSSSCSSIPEQVQRALASQELVLVRPATLELRFDAFIKHLEILHLRNSTTSMYLEYLSMKSYVDKLRDDTPMHAFIPDKTLELVLQNLWYGHGQTTGKLHFDPFENLMTVVSGVKEFLLYDPRDNSRLYEGHLREAKLKYDVDTDTFLRQDLLESTSMVNSPVDPLHPNLDKYPEFQHAPSMRCRIEASETLYLPSFWWHEVYSTQGVKKNTGSTVHHPKHNHNMAVNFWFEPLFQKDFPCKTCTLRFNHKVYASLLRAHALATNDTVV